MQPDVLGLGADESAAYRALITVPSAGPDEFASLMRVPAENARNLLAGLETRGLAVRSLGDPDRFVAAPPAPTLREPLPRRREELARAEAELGVLDEVYRAAALRPGAPGVVDVLPGAAEIREVFGRLQLGARDEVLSLVKAPIAVISAADNVEQDSAVARGVRYRVVFERAMLDEEPDAYARIVAARAAGEQIRIADAVPVKLLIVDRAQAFMPLHAGGPPGALLIRESGLVRALVALFEFQWRKATPDGGRSLDESDARIVGLLMTGLTDEAVAAHLGTSLRTVQRRVRHLMEVTGGRTRMQLGFHVARLGWLD
ncbi:helix-turn-helix domain-containing protein [Paractinoplanes ferrugineus]|uniref:helix-turn-helix domain-containing protein n=1 Tax=Paractinoplanes ferrugineus TaxID=113564 RepID=UPI001942CF5A|nr:helix-turn-helix domain-containing protein [Actinoplanes ferrugineus]